MLSRIAESLFWIGRYVERAEDTARILEVQTQLILEDPTVDAEATCRGLLSVMGVEVDDDAPIDTGDVLRVLAYDLEDPHSISAVLAAARESARRARETLSTVLWEAINTTWRAVPTGRFQSMQPASAFRWVRDRAALVNGTADESLTRGEGWQFLNLGRAIERADMTARLVASASLTGGAAWAQTLRACGGYEAYLRAYRGLETERGAAEFLLLDRLFPRSVVYALSRGEQCLVNLDSPTGRRAGIEDEAQRLLGRARTELEYRALSEVLADLPGEMERVQLSGALATNAISRRFFAGSEATMWRSGRG